LKLKKNDIIQYDSDVRYKVITDPDHNGYITFKKIKGSDGYRDYFNTDASYLKYKNNVKIITHYYTKLGKILYK
jgi:hypothetical protein